MAPLYHGTSSSFANSILKDNNINASYGDDGDEEYASLTRSFKYAQQWVKEQTGSIKDAVIFELDQQKLSYNYKIKPHNYFVHTNVSKKARYLRDDPVFGANEYEERVYKDITPLSKYLISIHVFNQAVANKIEKICKSNKITVNIKVHK